MAPVTQMKYILKLQKTELSQVPQEYDQINTCPTRKVPDKTQVRTNWQNAQITLSVHKLTPQ